MKLKNLLLIALVAIVFCGCQSNYQPTSITVASYNLRNANGGDSINGNGWGQRYPVIAQIVQYHDFDIFGTQECFIHQLKDMKEALPGYDYIGVGRDDGKEKGEHSAIFYRTDKFDVIEKGDFWLYLLKAKIPTAVFYLCNVLCGNFSYFFIGNFQKLFFNQLFSDFSCILACIVHKILLKRHKRIWMTAVLNLTAFAKRHKSVACSALTITSRAE